MNYRNYERNYQSNSFNSKQTVRKNDFHPNTQNRKPHIKASDYANYVDRAEAVIEYLISHEKKITTSKIRNILAMAADIYNDIKRDKSESISEENRKRLEYLRVRMIYEAGRTKEVQEFLIESDLCNELKKVNGKKTKYVDFYHYLEALVAFHKYNGGE